MELVLYRRRTAETEVTVFSPDGTATLFSSGNVMRIKIGRPGETPLLDLDSIAASPAGTTVEAANPSDVRFAAADVTTLPPGTYEMEASIWAGDHLRNATPGIVHVIDTMGGDVGNV